MATQLEEAQAAYHKLVTGSQAQELWENGRKIVYTPADINKLSAYISKLEALANPNNSPARMSAISIKPAAGYR